MMTFKSDINSENSDKFIYLIAFAHQKYND